MISGLSSCGGICTALFFSDTIVLIAMIIIDDEPPLRSTEYSDESG